jgi:hypothetical protein
MSRSDWVTFLERGEALAERDLELVFDGEVPDVAALIRAVRLLSDCTGCYATVVRGYLRRLIRLDLIDRSIADLVHVSVAQPHWDNRHLPRWV